MNDDLSTLEPTLLRAVWRYRWLVLFIALATTGAAYWYATSSSSEEFAAVASIQVQDPRSSFVGASVSRAVQSQYVSDQAELLQSGEVARRASETAIAADPSFPYDTTDFLERSSISQVGETSVINARFRASTSAGAVLGANSIIEGYRDLINDELRRTAQASLDVFDVLIAERQQQMDANDSLLRELTTESSTARSELELEFDRALPRLRQLFNQLPSASDDRRAEILDEISGYQAQVDVLRAINALDQESQEVQALIREQTRLALQIDDLSESREQILIDQALLGSVGIPTPAFTAESVETDLARLMIVGVFLGLLVGAGLAYLLALRRRTITDRTQPELVLGAPLIAAVPSFRQEGIRTPLPVRTDPRSASAEAFRFAASALDLSRPTPAGAVLTAGKVVAVTSAGLGEGKTVVAANTALAAAREGKRVLLIDADFGNQMATALLLPEERPTAGLTEVVETGLPLSEAIVPLEGTGATGLHLLARGWRQTTAPEFFRLGATREFLEQVQDYYDLVIVDAPPVLHMAYASTLLGLVDKALIVVPHESSATTLEELQDRLDLIGTPTVGYIYNLAPLRSELTRTEGSMRDVLGTAPELPTG